jgi:hypothetical protein
MRLSNAQAVARPVYYDRNQIPRLNSFSISGAAPHGSTQRWLYTVPAGKKAFIEWLQLSTHRDTAAAPVAPSQVWFTLVLASGPAAIFMLLEHADNTLQLQRHAEQTSFGLMVAGDQMSGNTVDTSTGGTQTYNLVGKLTEFDA